MLTSRQLAKISNELQVPAVLSNLIEGSSDLSDDIHYALHDVISDLAPDEALLCIAIAGHKISALSENNLQTLPIMRMECERIIEEYGTLWLDHANENQASREDKTIDMLDMITEDLEGLTELLEFCSDFVFYDNKVISEICTILQIQARAHAMVASEFARAADIQSQQAIENLIRAGSAVTQARKTSLSIAAASNTDNVIQFPFRPRE